jgi:hypothetical protein
MSNKLKLKKMQKFIFIPAGRLADDDAALKARREELRKKLEEGGKISINPRGNVTTGNVDGKTIIPPGKLAEDDEALKRIREKRKNEILRNKLINKEPVYIGQDGKVSPDQNKGANLTVPKGVLAINQWYEKDPGLLAAEKAAMAHAFPHFQLEKLDDGRLAWTGSLNIGVLGDNAWYIMAVYNNNHPAQVMGSSVRVYLVEPDINEIINDLGWSPTHLLRDSSNQLYLCTAEAGNIKTGKEVTSAAYVIAWAVNWLLAFELVLTGDLPKEKFNEHGGI